MVKNYLVGAVRPVIKRWYSSSPQGATQDNPNSAQDLGLYQAMYDLSRASARKFLQGDWQEICHRAPCLDARMFQIAQWYLVKELWFSEPCNILCMGSDTLFLQPTDMFGTWPDMRLFNYTEPRGHAEFRHYFNDDVRYFPHSMDPEIWNLAERRMADWFTHAQAHWDCGQLIHNSMFWSQSINDNDRRHPYLNWMAHGIVHAPNPMDTEVIRRSSEWNGCPVEHARIMHFNGSRNAAVVVDAMTQFARQSGTLT
jgi:hypothetical protein